MNSHPIGSRAINRHLFASVIYLIAVFLVFEWTDADLWIQDFFYNAAQQSWLWDKQEPVLKLVLYKGPKALLILLALALIVGLSLLRFSPFVQRHRQAMIIVLASLIVVPILVGWIKASTNTACPVALQQYGGEIPYIKVMQSYPHGQTPAAVQKCFPAGHASGGFALLSLVFFFRTRKEQLIAGCAALSLGWLMGNYKMVIGDHFFSHTLITQGLAWFVTCLIAKCTYRLISEPKLTQITNRKLAHGLR